MVNLQLNGQYIKYESALISKNNSLVIGKRNNPTPKKPLNYLLLKKGNRCHYVSSLYPKFCCPNQYTFDYAGKSYTYIQEGDTVTIECTL